MRSARWPHGWGGARNRAVTGAATIAGESGGHGWMEKKLLSAAVAAALMAPSVASAIDFKISGHVNRMIRFADDGKGSDIQNLDNEASRTRFRFRGSQDIGNGTTAGIYIETSVSSANSSETPLKSNGVDIAFDIRHSRLSFSGRWGQVMLGHTSTVLDGKAQADLSGNTVSDWAESAKDYAGAIVWRTNTGGTLSGPACSGACTVLDARNSFDGGRDDLIRYDSPALGPLVVQGSIQNGSEFDVGAELSSDVAGGQLLVVGGYQHSASNNNFNAWAASGSYLFSQGTSITAQLGGLEFKKDLSDRPDAFTWWVKLAHKWGNNVLSASVGQTQDLVADGADALDVGVGFNHVLKKPGIELYAGYKFFTLDTNSKAKAELGITGESVKDINAFVVGSRVKFN